MTLDHNTEEGRTNRIWSMLIGDLEDAMKALDVALESDVLTDHEKIVVANALQQVSTVTLLQKVKGAFSK